MKKIRVAICLFSIIVSMLASVIAQSGGNFTITKSVVAGGGGSASGGTFTLDGTIGQSVAGTTSTGGTFELGGGFWGGSAPAAVEVSVSGRVTTPAGNGLRNAIVTITDGQGAVRSALTTSFGFYNFNNVLAGQTYVIRVSSKRFRFASRTLEVNNTLTDVDFVGLQ